MQVTALNTDLQQKILKNCSTGNLSTLPQTRATAQWCCRSCAVGGGDLDSSETSIDSALRFGVTARQKYFA
jgi:hypothetical protein